MRDFVAGFLLAPGTWQGGDALTTASHERPVLVDCGMAGLGRSDSISGLLRYRQHAPNLIVQAIAMIPKI